MAKHSLDDKAYTEMPSINCLLGFYQPGMQHGYTFSLCLSVPACFVWATPFESLGLETAFLVCRSVFRISRLLGISMSSGK